MVLQKYINKIICGESYEILLQLPDDCIDMIITSPPYNVDIFYDTHKDCMMWDNYFHFLFDILYECNRILVDGGRMAINIAPFNREHIPTHHIISEELRKYGMIWRDEIIWDKHTFSGPVTTWGSYKSPSSPYLKDTCEFIEVFSKGNIKKEGDKDKIDITADEFKKWVIGPWSITPETQMKKKYNHPAMFPEHLVERLIKLYSYQDDIILDPFNGVGTTCIMSDRLKRRYIGIDISEEYTKTAQLRIDNENMKKVFFDV